MVWGTKCRGRVSARGSPNWGIRTTGQDVPGLFFLVGRGSSHRCELLTSPPACSYPTSNSSLVFRCDKTV
eukprot:77486-Prorocentrum_minimum.AAC.1